MSAEQVKSLEDRLRRRLPTITIRPQSECESFIRKFLNYPQNVLKLKQEESAFQVLFMNKKTSQERVALLLKDSHVFPAIKELVSLLVSRGEKREKGKCLQKASNCRKEGNEFYKKKDIEKALEKYNEAMLWAPHDPTDELSLCFANRSATLFSLDLFQAAILDIEEARELNYPKNRVHILLLRKIKCLKSLGEDGEAETVRDETRAWAEVNVTEIDLKAKLLQQVVESMAAKVLKRFPPELELALEEEPNQRLYGAVRKVKMCYNSSEGRTVEAVDEIVEGDVIMVEKPFVSWLNPPYYHDHCHHCLEPLTCRFVACSQCSLVRFCSSRCQKDCWRQYHSVECSYLDLLKELSVNQMPLRMALINGIEKTLREHEVKTRVSYDKWPSKDFKHDTEALSSLCFRPDHGTDFPRLYARTFSATLLAYFASEVSLASPKDILPLGAYFVELLLQIEANAFVIYDQQLKPSKYKDILVSVNDDTEIGTGLYGTAAIFSHRCFCNTYRLYFGSKMIITASTVIKPGEEVTVDYLGNAKVSSYFERQRLLKQKCGFKCCCIDCVNRRERPELRCPKCHSNLIVNEDKSNRCENSTCGAQNQSLDSIIYRGSIFDTTLEQAIGDMERGLWDEAESRLKACEDIYGRDLHEDNYKHLLVKETLSLCFEAKKMTEKAIECRLKVAHYEEIYWGPNSFHALVHLVKVVELYVDNRKEKKEEKSLLNAKKHFEKCSLILRNICRMQLKTATIEQIALIPKMVALAKLLDVPEVVEIVDQLKH